MSKPTFENGGLILAVAVRMRLGDHGIECGPLSMRLYDRRPAEVISARAEPLPPRPADDGAEPAPANVVPFRKH